MRRQAAMKWQQDNPAFRIVQNLVSITFFFSALKTFMFIPGNIK
jgi:hypothetical protein